MPRYFFHTFHDSAFVDLEGEVLDGPKAAHREAMRVLGDIVRDGPAGFLDEADFRVVCVDASGGPVVVLSAGRRSADEALRPIGRIVSARSAELRPIDRRPTRDRSR